MNLMNSPKLHKQEIEMVGKALSTAIQVRYNWLFCHIARGYFLTALDLPNYSLPKQYAFSQEDIDSGKSPIDLENFIDLLLKSNTVYATEGSVEYNYNYVRELSLTALRISVIINIQSCFEVNKIINICKDHDLPEERLFDFVRQVRNIICHGNGIMNSKRITYNQWRNIIIENNGKSLEITDYLLHDLMNECIGFLAQLYWDNGKKLDTISLNLGYTIPTIKKFMVDRVKKEIITSFYTPTQL